jgi:hypothetical protein
MFDVQCNSRAQIRTRPLTSRTTHKPTVEPSYNRVYASQSTRTHPTQSCESKRGNRINNRIRAINEFNNSKCNVTGTFSERRWCFITIFILAEVQWCKSVARAIDFFQVHVRVVCLLAPFPTVVLSLTALYCRPISMVQFKSHRRLLHNRRRLRDGRRFVIVIVRRICIKIQIDNAFPPCLDGVDDIDGFCILRTNPELMYQLITVKPTKEPTGEPMYQPITRQTYQPTFKPAAEPTHTHKPTLNRHATLLKDWIRPAGLIDGCPIWCRKDTVDPNSDY